MARPLRIVLPGCPHHVVQRGNHKEDVFFRARDRDIYRQWLREYSLKHGLEFLAYCLMTNHIHLIGVPAQEDSLGLALGKAHTRYSQWMNRVHDWSGHLWGDRYRSVPMDDAHLWNAIKYVELNPVRAGLVTRAEAWPWSSARAHVFGMADPLLSARGLKGGPPLGKEWGVWLREDLDPNALGEIRYCTRVGRPLGSREFVTEAQRRVDARGERGGDRPAGSCRRPQEPAACPRSTPIP